MTFMKTFASEFVERQKVYQKETDYVIQCKLTDKRKLYWKP